MNKKFSLCEIVEIAVQIEKNGRDFYSGLVKRAENPETKKAFEYLAEAEGEHITAFKEIFDASCDYSPEGAYTDDYFAYMNALASDYVFTDKMKPEEVIQRMKTFEEAIDLGICMEKDSILLYEEMKDIVPEKSRPVVEKILSEEKEHFRKLCDLKGGCGDEECKSV